MDLPVSFQGAVLEGVRQIWARIEELKEQVQTPGEAFMDVWQQDAQGTNDTAADTISETKTFFTIRVVQRWNQWIYDSITPSFV